MTSKSSDISIEPLFNQGKSDGSGAKVTAISEIGAMSHRTPLTITETPQQILIGANKTHMEIQNIGTEDIYVGGSGVASTSGLRIFTDYGKTFSKVKSTFNFYAVCAAGKTSTLVVIEYS